MFYLVTFPQHFVQKNELGSVVWAAKLFPTYGDKNDPQSMCVRDVEPNKYWCHIISPHNSPHIN